MYPFFALILYLIRLQACTPSGLLRTDSEFRSPTPWRSLASLRNFSIAKYVGREVEVKETVQLRVFCHGEF